MQNYKDILLESPYFGLEGKCNVIKPLKSSERNIDIIIKKLFLGSLIYQDKICLGSSSFVKNKKGEKDYRETFLLIKNKLKDITGEEEPSFNMFYETNTVYFLYLHSETSLESGNKELHSFIEEANIYSKEKLLNSLLTLFLYINQDREDDNEIIEYVNGRTLVSFDTGASKGKAKSALEIQIKTDNKANIYLNLVSKAITHYKGKQDRKFQIKHVESIASDIDFYFTKCDKPRNFFSYTVKNAKKSRFYITQRLLEQLIGILEDEGLEYGFKAFIPDNIVREAFSLERNIEKPITIINNSGKTSKEIQELFDFILKSNRLEEKLSFNVKEIISVKDFKEFDDKEIYLVLNDDNQIKCFNCDDEFNTSKQAYYARKENPELKFDFYTNIKIDMLDKLYVNRIDNKVIQALSINDIWDEYLNRDDKKANGNYKNNFTSMRNKIKKITTELILKDIVKNRKPVVLLSDENNLPDKTIRAYFTNVTKKNNRKKLIISAIEYEIKKGVAEVTNIKVFNEEDELEEEGWLIDVGLTSLKEIPGDISLLYDVETGFTLKSTTNDMVPQIVGNNKMTLKDLDKITTYPDNGEPYFNRFSKQEDYHLAILPYYMINDYVSVIEFGKKGALLFTTNDSSLSGTASKQTRINKISVHKNHFKHNVIENYKETDIFYLYLLTLTSDVLNVSGMSKTSVLNKLAKIVVDN